jgi:hypothetical protein
MTKAAHPDQNQQDHLMLHDSMKFMLAMIALGEQMGEPGDPAITGQPLFKGFHEILQDIPKLENAKDFENFAQRREQLSGTWMSSMQSMDSALQGNFSVAYLIDQFLHRPKEMESEFLAATKDELSLETLAPMLNMLKLLASSAIGHADRTHFQKTSGNPFGQARCEGGAAEVSARSTEAVNAREENSPTKPIKRMVEKRWHEALNTPGSYGGVKAEFVRKMLALIEREHKEFSVTERTMTDWIGKWGGKLQRIKVGKKLT